MPVKRFIFLCVFFISIAGKINAQALSPVKWAFSYKDIDETTIEISLKATIGDGWHIYSQLQNGDGPLPTIFTFERTPEFELVDKVIEPDPERTYSDVFAVDVMMFSKEAVFTQKIKRNTKKSFTIMGNVECMACNSSQCLPPKTYKFSIPVAATQ